MVADASAVLEILLNTEAGLDLSARLHHESLDAPHLIDLEVAQTLRRWIASGKMSVSEAELALATFLLMPITRHGHLDLIPEVWALRHDLTAYDAAYLALASRLDAPLITMDEGLRKRAGRR